MMNNLTDSERIFKISLNGTSNADSLKRISRSKLCNIPVAKSASFTPAPVKVQSIKTYNERVLIIRFSDGTFSKAMCEEGGRFDFDMLFTIAYMKRMLGVGKTGHKAYHKLIDEAHKIVKKQEKDENKPKEEAARKKRTEKKAPKKVDKSADTVCIAGRLYKIKSTVSIWEDDPK